MQDFDLHVIEFGTGDNDRVVVHGRRLPFRFGKVIHLTANAEGFNIVIVRDVAAERRAEEQEGFFSRWFSWKK